MLMEGAEEKLLIHVLQLENFAASTNSFTVYRIKRSKYAARVSDDAS